jgi:hypothetical protein
MWLQILPEKNTSGTEAEVCETEETEKTEKTEVQKETEVAEEDSSRRSWS